MNNHMCSKMLTGPLPFLLLPFLAVGCGKKEGSDKSTAEKKPAAGTPCEKLAQRVVTCRKKSKGFIKKLVLRTCNRDLKNEETRALQEKINACLEKSACEEFLKCREAGMNLLRDFYFKKAAANKKAAAEKSAGGSGTPAAVKKGHPALPIFRKTVVEVCACKDLACAKTKGMAGGLALKKHRSHIGTPAEEAELKALLKKFKACLNKLKTQPRK